MWALGRCAEVAVQIADVQACRQHALAQGRQVAFDQAGGVGAFGPQLAAEAALDQLCLYLQRAERLHVERQFDAPELLFGRAFFGAFLGLFSFVGLLALELDLQWHDVLQVAHRDLQLPGTHQPSVRGDAGLLQAGQLVTLQAGNRRGGQAQQVFQIVFAFGALQ
ncbi:hypothetical protein D3C84_898340 [compost metagenome]